MSKRRIQEGNQGDAEERAVAKSRPARNLVSMTVSNNAEFELISKPGNLTAICSTFDSLRRAKLVAMDSKQNHASDSQVWHIDTNRKLRETSCEIEKGQRWSNIVPRQFRFTARHCRVKVLSYVRQKLGRPEEEQINTNAMIWRP